MEFGQLRIFQAVAEEGSIARAAERLHRVPSNLSTRLRQLEEQLGVDLFLRERQRLQLSPAGKVLLDYAARLFALQEEARAAVQGGRTGGRLRPRLDVQHRGDPPAAAPSGELVESLLGGRLDAVLVDGPLDFDGLEGLPMFEERMVLVTENGHPPVRGPEDVAGSAVIAFRPRCSYRLLLESWFASARVSMGRVMEIESYHSMLACVVAGGGVALMPVSMLQSLPGRESVAVHALAEPFARANTWLVWRKGMVGANLKAWIGLLQGRESALA